MIPSTQLTYLTRNIAIKKIRTGFELTSPRYVSELFYSGKIPHFFLGASGNKSVYFSNLDNRIYLSNGIWEENIYPPDDAMDELHQEAEKIVRNSISSNELYSSPDRLHQWTQGLESSLLYMEYTQY